MALPPTAITLLITYHYQLQQDAAQCALRGTKTAAALGLTRLISDYEKRKSHGNLVMSAAQIALPAVSGGVRVISDPYYQAYAGDVAAPCLQAAKTVWRYPEHTVVDACVLTALLPPAGMILHDNCLVMSCVGKDVAAITAAAAGCWCRPAVAAAAAAAADC
ncbi:hypothetical protein AK812_SmicGene19554 [Symbiodinium microadriaticum]|uniref:Uncharacterized protein n=1 Tax=Symbiodinium microadriaticum TaxID=2951 RepID=A0A1Q9DS72_SYMMI|nr:hypothetical protein AK812_SmicGene19554 [Symbiodinium microadriaticum]